MKHDGKDDKGKVRPTLLPIEGIEGMLEVMEYGAKKYCVGGWREVPNAEARYKDALLRHLFEELKQPGSKDEESGLSHMAHAACNALFLLSFQRKSK